MAITLDDIPELMTRHQTAGFLNRSVSTVDRMIKDGELEAVKIRGAVRVSRTACVAALNGKSNLRRRGRPRKVA
jgi:excisionase family DNA binding protein